MRYALVRQPGLSVVDGQRMNKGEPVDPTRAKQQHAAYCRALERMGYRLLWMPTDEAHPDSVFVEDPAIILRDEVLIITRLRGQGRSGEEESLERKLRALFDQGKVFKINAPGFVEGGDVLVAHDHLYIGLSARTNPEGAEQLARIARDVCDMTVQMVNISADWLHLKGGVSYHHDVLEHRRIITVTERIADQFSDWPFEVIVMPDEEKFGANCIAYGDHILIHKGCVQARGRLEDAGFAPKEIEDIDFSEYRKIDGAMSCGSKLFARPGA